MSEVTKAYLLLEDGTFFEGKSVGAQGTTTGEICFNTGMTGYQEVFSDPSYSGQIIIMTNTHIGNYGATSLEVESDSVKINGLICKRFSSKFSRIQAEDSLQNYLEDYGVVGISEVDTRALVSYVRNKGAMNCIISTEFDTIETLKAELSKAPSMDGLELASVVSTKEVYELGDENAAIRVAVLDFGVKKNILKNLIDRDCYVKVYPAKTTFSEMEKFKPSGYFLSNGPGDPAVAAYAVKTVKEIINSGKPTFGICFGHQIIALANDISTYKMHHGHRGLNHPIINLETGLCEITSQNHGFGISKEDLDKNENVIATHKNLNDDTIEGIRMKDKDVFSVQYHPESSPGAHDSRYLFDNFVKLMTK